MNRLKRIFLASIASLLGLIVVLILLLSTSSGLNQLAKIISWSLAKKNIELTAKDLSGNVFDFHINQLEVDSEELGLSASDVTLDWRPWSLWFGKINIKSLSIEKLNIRQLSKQSSQQSSSPINLRLDHLTINHMLWQNRDLGSLKASVYTQNQQLQIQSVKLIHPDYVFHGTGSLNLAPHYSINAEIHWRIMPLQAQGQILVYGNLQSYALFSHSLLGNQNQAIATINMALIGNEHSIRSEKIAGTALGGQINGQFYYDWQNPYLQLDVSGQKWQLGQIENNLPVLEHVHINAQIQDGLANIITNLSANNHSLNMSWSGKQNQHDWDFVLKQLQVNIADQQWQAKDSQLHIGSTVALSPLCLKKLQAKICAKGSWQEAKWDFSAWSQNLTFNSLKAFFPLSQLNGNIDFSLSANELAGKAPDGQFSLKLSKITLNQSDTAQAFSPSSQILNTAKLNASLHDHQLTSHLNSQLNTTDFITGNLNMDFTKVSPELSGEVSASLSQLGFIDDFIPQVFGLNGHLNANVKINGTWQQPIYQGEINLLDSTFDIPALGISLNQVNLSANALKQSILQIQGSAKSGQGILHIQGSVDLNWFHPQIALLLNGDNFTLIDLPGAYAVVNANLNYSQSAINRSLIGNIILPSARFDSDNWKSTASKNEDIVIVHQSKIEHSNALPFTSKLKIQLGKTVSFSGNGLTTNLTGQLTINNSAEGSSLANGILQLNQGEYVIYGKHFTINKGTLTYTQSPLDNPNLDISAKYELNPTGVSNNLDRLEIGVSILGTAQAPNISLFSSPPLSQEDILSYIVLGQPLSKAQDKSALSQAALAFALSGGSKSVLQNIQQYLGLNQLTVGSLNNATPEQTSTNTNSQTSDTAIFVGKQISDRISISYGVGLFTAEQIFRTQVRLSKDWSLWTNSSTLGSGIDLIYSFEK